jgi:XTP/dITP diphosphohydrolase
MNTDDFSTRKKHDHPLPSWTCDINSQGRSGLAQSEVKKYFKKGPGFAVRFRVDSSATRCKRCAFNMERRGTRMKRVLVATSNPGKIRDLIGAAASHNISIETLPGFASLPGVIEDGATFEDNARKKAEYYSKYAEGELVIADDSGLEVDALEGAPGVRSARYAADEPNLPEHAPNSDDAANNARLLRELHDVPDEYRTGRFVCVIAVARNGHSLATFHGRAEGLILHAPRGSNGFGYDPLFYFAEIGKTFAELTAEEKARYSHRGAAFRQFLEWEDESPERHPHID